MATETRRSRIRIDDWSGVTTTVVIPDGQERWYYNVTGYQTDEIIRLVGDGVTTIASLLKRQELTDGAQTIYGNKTFDGDLTVNGDFELPLPIGFIYWQLPGKDSPTDLNLTGTWTNVSSTFAGDFFRAEGGSAATFESGEQADAMQRITGQIPTYIGSGSWPPSATGVFSAGTKDADSSRASGSAQNDLGELDFDSNDSTSPNAAKTDDVETRPVNHTIRLWERTA